MRSGYTLLEMTIVLLIVAIIAGLAIPAMIGMRDRLTVRLAAIDTNRALSDARSMALASARRTAVRIDQTRNTVTVYAGADTLRTLRLDDYGVTLRSTRDSIAWGPTGIGWGAATATITLTRGTASTALAVSRLGRVRRT
ncbi:MAG: prepilin-type N-terminal cleavage/methylation domain-containing protein [Gemmatimonadaceae bacterium]|nr:prepilin-type N-terminal cleavage/methylation domain-containing protein [Gemmatimonadaceae bacterium]